MYLNGPIESSGKQKYWMKTICKVLIIILLVLLACFKISFFTMAVHVQNSV